MIEKETSSNQANILRRQAEEKVARMIENQEDLSPEEAQRILYELRVHQIELEMQNNELRLAYAELDAVRASCFDIYDMAPVGYCTISEKGLILEANFTAATLLGLARGALIKQHISRFILEEDQDIYYLQRKQLFETDEPQDWDMRMVKKDGTVFWAHLKSTVALDAEENPVCRIVVSDITKSKRADMLLRESEQNFRTLADSGRALIWTSGTDKLCNYFNRVWLEFTGRKLEQEMGNGWAEGVHPDDLQSCLDIYVGAFDRREKFSMEYRMLRYDGEYRWIIDDGCPRYDSRGEFIGYIGHCLDISERKHDEEENAKLEAQLRHAQKMESIGFLAGGIAHDLNNILFPISGLSEMLLDDIPSGNPEHKSIEQIYKSAQRGSDLVKQILAFSRQSKPQKLPIKIQSILKEVLRLVRSTIPMNIEITSHIKPDCGMVSADPTQVHQIAMNLITNAYHAVERNGGTIDIELKETGPPDVTSEYSIRLLAGGYACIIVSDTGTGIDKTLMDKIFDPYFTTKELGKGTGLGLSVVYGIVKEHGGDIQVYSEVGKGTAFHVYLPLLLDANDSKSAVVTREYPTGRERILLVDDEEPIARMEQIMLERLGYQVTARTSSLDALAAFKANPGHFDLVISDKGMPLMTGEQLSRELILIKPGIPIIICTGFSDENDVNRAMSMGIKGFLMKPVATGDLATMVRKVLDDAAN
ncbi:MAG: PAS domain S-box protein [Deltaproteobacteria bacterium]